MSHPVTGVAHVVFIGYYIKQNQNFLCEIMFLKSIFAPCYGF